MKQSAMLRFREDEIILRQGGLERELYKIISGKAAVYFNFGKPDEDLVGILSEQLIDLEELVQGADRRMYLDKQEKKGCAVT